MARTYAETQKKMELSNKAVAANAAELPHLEPKRLRLDDVLTEAKSLTAEQASLAARKQEVSKRLAELMEEGHTLVKFLDTGVKQHYGKGAEKLVEFGLQPFRRRSRSTQVGANGKPPKASTDKDKEPTQHQPATS